MAKKHKGNQKDFEKAFREKVKSLILKHIQDDNCADYYGKHNFGTEIKAEFLLTLKPNEGMYCMWKAVEDAKKKLPNATGDKKILYAEIIDYYPTGHRRLILIQDTMLKPNFTTMKKISSCQIECEKALTLIDKMIENQDRDSIYDSQDNPVGYEICVDRLEGVAMDDDDDYYTPEEQETASKLQDELQANNIQSIIHFI